MFLFFDRKLHLPSCHLSIEWLQSSFQSLAPNTCYFIFKYIYICFLAQCFLISQERYIYKKLDMTDILPQGNKTEDVSGNYT